MSDWASITLADLHAAVQVLRPASRIIIGLPGVGAHDVAYREREGVILIGKAAYRQLLATVPRLPASDQIGRLQGFPIEEFDYVRHRELLEAIWPPPSFSDPVADRVATFLDNR